MDELGPENHEVLMQRYLGGEERAFELLYQATAPRVFAYLLKRVSLRADAEELLQQVFIKFHRNRESFDFQHSVSQFLFVIAKTALIDFYRQGSRRVKIEEGANIEEASRLIESEEEASPRTENLERLSAGLSDEQKQVLEWRYLNELQFNEIAARLGKSEVSVRKILSRAIQKMRSALAVKGRES